MSASTPSAGDRSGIQVIARAASILRALENRPAGLSLSELAARLDLARSTVQRIVGALTEEGLLVGAGPRGGVTLGPTLTRLAASAIIDTERVARPVLQKLSSLIGETVDLSVLQGSTVVFVDQVVGTSRLVAISAIGEAFPLHCTANGKALLAKLPPERRDQLLPKRLREYTPRTITERRVLIGELEQVAVTGIAWDDEEHAEGISAAGTAFVDPIGRLFAVSIPVPTARFAMKREQMSTALAAACRELVVGLGVG